MNPVNEPPASAFPSSFPAASGSNRRHSAYNPPTPNIASRDTSFTPVLPPPGGADGGSVPVLQPLETDKDAFSTAVIEHRRYRHTNRVAYIEADADIFLVR